MTENEPATASAQLLERRAYTDQQCHRFPGVINSAATEQQGTRPILSFGVNNAREKCFYWRFTVGVSSMQYVPWTTFVCRIRPATLISNSK